MVLLSLWFMLPYLWEVGLELGCVKHVLEVSQLLVRDLPLPLKLTSALCDLQERIQTTSAGFYFPAN